MSRVEVKLAAVAIAAALCAGLSMRPALALFEAIPLLKPVNPEAAATYLLKASAYPSALPNDGRAEAELTVKVEHDGAAVAGVKVAAAVLDGGGALRDKTAITDQDGVARFSYRAGMMPFEGRLSFELLSTDQTARAPEPVELVIPIAPVSYLDIQLVTPEEYERLKNLRTRAAAIYKLSLSCFPQQLAADGGSMATVCCELRDVLGKPAVGVALTAKLASGDGTILQSDKVTDASGKLYVDYIAGTTPGTAVIKITEPSSGLSQNIDLTLVKAGPVRIKLRYGGEGAPIANREGTFLPADSVTELPLVAEVTDLAGVPLSGVELRLEVLDSPANGWLETLACKSDGRGLVRFTYHAGSQPGKVRLRAYAATGLDKLQVLGTS
jgi:5-hydroxyisourate hydrolase-like protein (transthyretin family)